jgi:hypothetical protein
MRLAIPARNFLLRGKQIGIMFVAIFSFALSAAAQVEGPIHPQAPVQSSAAEQPAPGPLPPGGSSMAPDIVDLTTLPFVWPQPELPPPELPERVAVPAGRPIAVVLDTPLSTRIAKRGQVVTFRTTGPLRVTDDLEIPPDVEILGHVSEAKRPGHFGKAGVLRVTLDNLHLESGGVANLDAHLDSADMKGQGRLTTDNRRSTDLYSVMMDSIQGTLMGGAIGGAKGAAMGAGAGAAIAILIMMSHRGQDVYLEPGMPFTVILDQPAYLSGAAIYSAQQNYQQANLKSKTSPADANSRSNDQNGGAPKLKRRSQQPRN